MRTLLALLVFVLPAAASASGPVALFGGVYAHARDQRGADGSGVEFGAQKGGHLEIGYEFGDFWNHQLAFVFSQTGGAATVAGNNAQTTVSLRTVALSYQLTYEFFGKDLGFSPYAGAGLWIGSAAMHVTATDGTNSAVQDGSVGTLELHLVGGARYLLANGVSFRGEVLYSTYGGFLGTVIPLVGVAYRL